MWPRPGNESNQASCIDRFYFPGETSFAVSYEYQNCPYSDHDCVFASLNVASMGKASGYANGKSYWMSNAHSVLCKDDFRDKFINKYSLWQTLKPVRENPADWWENLKCRTKHFCIQYCTECSMAFKIGLKPSLRN